MALALDMEYMMSNKKLYCNNIHNDVVEDHATALNCTITFLSIHVAKTDFSETFRPRGSSSVTNN